MASQEEIRSFYNNWVGTQKKTGVNLRHRHICRMARLHGMNRNSSVLEIGCGIGTLTSLLVKKAGKVVATDISDASIEAARKWLGQHRNLELVVTDMSDFDKQQKFDFIILPDVLEHIPVEQHAALFRTLRAHAHDNTVMLINIPHWRYLEWCHKHKPEVLQVIDQPLDSSELLNHAYPAGWVLDSLKSYSLFFTEYDYQFIIFRIKTPMKSVQSISKFQGRWRDLMARLFW